MDGAPSREDVVAGLNRVLASPTLPQKARQTAELMAERLSSPVRVALLGSPGAGKSTLRNVIAGAPVIPDGLRLPTTELRYGDSPGITATLSDGSKQEIAGLDLAALAALAASFAEIRAPLPALKKVTLLEVVTKGAAKDQSAAARWAAKRSEVAIWVTPDFSPAERAIWRTVPDSMKDHGFLVLSQIDKMDAAERAQAVKHHREAAREEFFGFFPAATKQGLSAVEGTAPRDAEIYRASGCSALVEELMRHVEMGTQADLDAAWMFLSRLEKSATPFARRTTGAESEAQTLPDDRGADADSPTADFDPTAAIGAEPLALDAGPMALDTVRPRDAAPDGAAIRAAQEAALLRLRANAETMLDDFTIQGGAATDMVLDRCVEAIEELCTLLPEDDPAQDAVLQAADVIVLLQLEKRDTAAEDAALVLLQLKRDFESALAA